MTQSASAVGSASDAQCIPAIPPCPCGKIMGKNGCEAGANKFGCTCVDMTSGFATPGTCVATNVCQASGKSGGDISQLMGMISQLMQAMKGSSDSGSGSGSQSGTQGCTTFRQTNIQGDPDPCSYYVPGSGASTSDLLSGLTSDNSATNDLVSSLVGSLGSNASGTSATTGSVSSAVVADISNPQDLKPGTSAALSQAAFGSAPGATGDIQVLSGNRVTLLASNRDIAGNKQTSGFSGFATSINEATHDVYVQVCAAREWANNFLTLIIPISYFDNLCTSHGYSITPPALQPYVPPPPPPGPPPPPPYLGPLKADIWASPMTVAKGARTSLFWSASGALSCKVSSNVSGALATTLSGNAAVGPLGGDTTYSIACQSASSSITNQVTVKVQ